MKNSKKHDILEEINKFPKIKTSETFLKDLHSKLDNIIAEEKQTVNLKTETDVINKKSIREYISGLISGKYLVQALGLTVVLILISYFIFRENGPRITEDKNNNTGQQKNPSDQNSFITGKNNNINNDTFRIIDPEKEFNKIIEKGLEVTEEGKKLIAGIISEKEKELRLFKPEEIVKNFGSFDPLNALKDIKPADLRSKTFSKKDLEVLKGKIDSLMMKK